MDKILKLYKYVDGGINDTPFPNSDNPIEIGSFRYDAKRMGGAPTITASVYYPSCLDDEWTDNVYAEFNGEKYFLKQTPTSSHNNEDERYKHDLELVSERRILDDVYFFDVVTGDPMDSDKPVSNSTKVVFFGNVHEFVARLNASLAYSHIDYEVVVDDEVETEEKLMSFEDQFFSNVLQEIYKTYEVPYYFDGKVIHIGWAKSSDVIPTFRYGVNDALLSITKNNANYKIVNRATATGSSDNIPFYYPNNSPKGNIEAVENGQLGVKVLDFDTFANKVDIDGVITYQGEDATVTKVTNYRGDSIVSGSYYATSKFTYKGYSTKYKMYITSSVKGNIPLTITPLLDFTKYHDDEDTNGVKASGKATIRIYLGDKMLAKSDVGSSGHTFDLTLPSGSSVLEINLNYVPDYDSSLNWFEGSEGLAWETDSHAGWYYKGEEVELKDLGLAISTDAPRTGDSITQRQNGYIKTSQNLMPYKYRESSGDERFYNATSEECDGWEFNNPYVEGRPKEHIFTVEDIKPTIKDTTVGGLRIDMFSEFAYDNDDNDETYEDEEGNVYFKHPYFYGKLRVMDFNLFDHAIENQPMTISFTSGDCGACNFEIGVTEEYPQKNPVQVDANGNLLRGANGMVLAGIEGTQQDVTTFQDRQQDTSKYEVWIALKKEEETYGILMPQGLHRPKAAGSGNDGDTFVILGINLPESYIINAEKKLEAEIIKYLKENNDEKFTFSINFSRIYFAEEENEDVLEQLSENSKIKVAYGVDENDLDEEGNPKERIYDLYVSSFSYNMSEGDVLPEIRVELDDTLKVSQNALQNAINEVKSQLGRALGSIDVVGAVTPYFIRKDTDDEARGRINFTKGVKFGEGGKVEVLDNNSAKLTIEYLEVTKKATFTSLEIQEKTHVGGQILVTPAAINCGEVKEFNDFYRCYFQTKGEDGDEIFNQFAIGDQAICQTFNAWGSKYYWRLVVGIGEDYVDLSKTECDEGSGEPQAGDKIIQLGNKVDEARQNAIVIAAYGDGSPYIIQYKGINNFELPEDKIVTKLSAKENILTGKVHMEMGSDGLYNLPEWIQVRDTANEALEKVDAIGESSFEELRGYVDAIAKDLQGQIDGAIDSYFYEYEPSLDSAPAVDWDTAEEKESHLNDTFTNLTDGRSWRWSKDSSNNYAWVEITDTATSEALRLAGKAQETADGKMTVFMSKPTPPYKAGDLWAGGENQPLKRCVNSRENGAFASSDWALADNAQQYADAIKEEITNSVNNTVADLNQAIADVEAAAKDYTDEGKKALEETITILEKTKANINDVYDKAAVDGKVTRAEQEAIERAEALADSARELAELNIKAWADGEIDEAEARAIAEAQAKVDAAKGDLNLAIEEMRLDLETRISNTTHELEQAIIAAKEASKNYTDGAKDVIDQLIASLESSKANLNDVYTKSVIDGKITTVEKNAIEAAENYTDAQNELLDISLKAWADGEIDEAEARAIAEAQAKVDAAKKEMEEYANQLVNGMNLGGENLLRNSGFTGDYLSEQLADQKVLEGASELYSAPFDHWTKGSNIVRVSLPNNAASGYGVQFPMDTDTTTFVAEVLGQELYYPVLNGDQYVFSFKAKSSKSSTTVSYTIGGITNNIAISEQWTRHIVRITPNTTTTKFELKAKNATICELQLERGKIATTWKTSPFDNASERAYYQSLKYLQNALDGATQFYGGLVLTEQIRIGDYDKEKKEWVEINGGMSGIYESDHDIAFWAGGTDEQAIETVMRYSDNPTYQPSQEELSSLANYVVTHGGRAILNDAIVRGTVYAQNGEFSGTVYADSGVFSGFIKKTPTIINPSNYGQYLLADVGGQSSWFDLDLSKAGTFVIFEGEWENSPHFYMPQLRKEMTELDDSGIPHAWKYNTLPIGYSVEEVFSLIGQKVIIMNNTNLNIQICTRSCTWIEPNQMAIYECEAKIVEDSIYGITHWEVDWIRKQLRTPDLTTTHPLL